MSDIDNLQVKGVSLTTAVKRVLRKYRTQLQDLCDGFVDDEDSETSDDNKTTKTRMKRTLKKNRLTLQELSIGRFNIKPLRHGTLGGIFKKKYFHPSHPARFAGPQNSTKW